MVDEGTVARRVLSKNARRNAERRPEMGQELAYHLSAVAVDKAVVAEAFSRVEAVNARIRNASRERAARATAAQMLYEVLGPQMEFWFKCEICGDMVEMPLGVWDGYCVPRCPRFVGKD